MPNRLLLAHAAPSVAEPLYRAALAPMPVPWEVSAFIASALPGVPGGGLSARYDALARSLDVAAWSGGRVDRLLHYLGLPARQAGDRVVLATWSGGYPIALWAMTDPALDGVVWLDSGHAAEISPGAPDPNRIAPAVAYAKRARVGEVLYHLLVTDIDPIAYASTTEIANAILQAAGGEGGLLHVERFPGATAQDHRDALTTDGPPFVARAIRAMLAYQIADVTPVPATDRNAPLRRGDHGDAVRELQTLLLAAGFDPQGIDGAFGPKTEAAIKGFQRVRHMAITGEADHYTLDALRARSAAPVASHEGLGLRALRVAEEQAAKGVHETPWGSNRGPEIDAYGAPVGMRGEPWCELFESWCRRQALLPGEADPLGYHAAVAAFWRAAVKADKARPITYQPRVGDAAIFRRLVNGHWHDPTKGGYGHVGRVKVPPMPGAKWITVDGNVRDRVDVVEHDDRADVVGWVEM
jgi:peptidoglycan hydrolase-like protein with peptidoglycan-binding domain